MDEPNKEVHVKKSSACMTESCVWVGIEPGPNRRDQAVKKSTASGNSNSCVYVGAVPGDDVDPTLVRVAHHPDGGRNLLFTREEWDAFVTGVKGGKFDTDRLVAEAGA